MTSSNPKPKKEGKPAWLILHPYSNFLESTQQLAYHSPKPTLLQRYIAGCIPHPSGSISPRSRRPWPLKSPGARTKVLESALLRSGGYLDLRQEPPKNQINRRILQSMSSGILLVWASGFMLMWPVGPLVKPSTGLPSQK